MDNVHTLWLAQNHIWSEVFNWILHSPLYLGIQMGQTKNGISFWQITFVDKVWRSDRGWGWYWDGYAWLEEAMLGNYHGSKLRPWSRICTINSRVGLQSLLNCWKNWKIVFKFINWSNNKGSKNHKQRHPDWNNNDWFRKQ